MLPYSFRIRQGSFNHTSFYFFTICQNNYALQGCCCSIRKSKIIDMRWNKPVVSKFNASREAISSFICHPLMNYSPSLITTHLGAYEGEMTARNFTHVWRKMNFWLKHVLQHEDRKMAFKKLYLVFQTLVEDDTRNKYLSLYHMAGVSKKSLSN